MSVPTPPPTFKRGKKVKCIPTALPAEHWARVVPGAKWRSCKKHGEAILPVLADKLHANGGRHLVALCPICLRHLDYLPQVRALDHAPADKQEAIYRRYLAEALAAGHRLGQAYCRFKARFGREPDPEWRGADHA